MNRPDRTEEAELSEGPFDRGSLLGIVAAPTIWAAHFLLVYVLGALSCARGAPPLASMLPIVAAATISALAGIALVSWPSWREWRGERDVETDHATAEGRSHFLAHASLLLAGLSIVAVLLQSLPALLSLSCR